MAYRVLSGSRQTRVGRPRKHEVGYCRAAKVIRLLEENFTEWRQIKHEEGFTDDNAVARYLLDCRRELTTMKGNIHQSVVTDNNVLIRLVL